ncbi:MAG: hypothetical protein M0026_18230 [Nocardiopsaceae bacterium]|nr:hypothetical protein [Nocardiopsaceae bacterium]
MSAVVPRSTLVIAAMGHPSLRSECPIAATPVTAPADTEASTGESGRPYNLTVVPPDGGILKERAREETLTNETGSVLKRTSAFAYTLVTHDGQHTVDFHCDQFIGHVTIKVDGALITTAELPHVGFSRTKKFEFDIGRTTRYRITIEMTRKLAFAGFRPLHYRILIDGVHVTSFER